MGKNDLRLIAALISAGLIAALAVFLSSSPGRSAAVRVEGETVAVIPLDKDGDYEIEGSPGGVNRLEVRDGSIRCSYADCPDHLCVKTGWASRAGMSIVCLPNHMVVEIEDWGDSAGGFDAITR